MDIGRVFILSAGIIVSIYKFWKNKEEIYLLAAIAFYLSMFHVGPYNLKKFFSETAQSNIDSISVFLLLLVFWRYFIFLFREMKKGKSG